MHPNDYFTKIFCINLDRRPDRWERCQEIFSNLGLTVERVSAVDGNKIEETQGKLTKPEIGCIMSHRGILERMVNENISTALILEDDVEFRENWDGQFDNAIGNVPRWDMMYLGCNHVTAPVKFQSNIVKVTRAYTTSSYAITREFAQMVIPELNALDRQVDVIYGNKHRTHPCYAIKPGICYQRADHSDIQGGYTDYTNYF